MRRSSSPGKWKSQGASGYIHPYNALQDLSLSILDLTVKAFKSNCMEKKRSPSSSAIDYAAQNGNGTSRGG